ncbi:hypothetical protein [Verminephrobacter aporrectodeae]|uniref:hypothetical protein n=1 Tax=Verminephrobacter aporrectodeae TaxID=1110389 RepID=UPI002238E3D1|nr:hypothetical protein [Verminephrobacter aporrectodeae]
MNLKSSLLQRAYQKPFIQWQHRVQTPRTNSIISNLAACFGTALALLCSPVHALEIRIKYGNDNVSEPLVANASGIFEFDAPYTDSFEVILDEKPVRIKRRQYYQAHLSKDGQHFDMPGAEKPGAFTSLRPALSWIDPREEIYEPNIKFPWKPSWAAATNERGGDWVEIAKGCANKDARREGSSFDGCYSFYTSRREFKVWLTGAARPVTIQVRFPGGC